MNMKALKLYIKEALHINKDTKGDYYNYHPKTKDELNELIEKLIEERGKNADLNDIDVSAITDMSYVFFSFKFQRRHLKMGCQQCDKYGIYVW